jgi:hypothetical protein
MEKISYVEQAPGSPMMILFTESGMVIPVSQNRIEEFIADNRMNFDMVVTGNNSPLGDGDPAYDIEELEMTCEPGEYLDSHLYKVCESYVNALQINNLLKHVA